MSHTYLPALWLWRELHWWAIPVTFGISVVTGFAREMIRDLRGR